MTHGENIDAWLVLVVADAGWMQKEQFEAIEYLRAQNRVLEEQLRAKGNAGKGNGRGKTVRFTEDQRRTLAVRGRRHSAGRHFASSRPS